MSQEKGKQNYIKIGSISEIDPNRLSISQINQRYIDSENNRYALRFNKEIRRIEIIKITTTQNVEVIKQTSMPTQTAKPQQVQASIPAKVEEPIKKAQPTAEPKFVERRRFPRRPNEPISEDTLLAGDIDLDIMGAESKSTHNLDEEVEESSSSASHALPAELVESRNPGLLVEHFIKVLGVYKERANAIVRNIQSSRIFEVTGDPSENKNIVGNLAREFEAQVFEATDKMVDLHKEMTSYPRPITYYISKAPADMREDMKMIDSDREKLEKLHIFEMQKHTTMIVNDMKKLSLQLLNILNLKSDIQVKQLQYANQLMYIDAKNASLYFAQDLDKTILEIENWKNIK